MSLDPNVKDKFGLPVAAITITRHKTDLTMTKFLVELYSRYQGADKWVVIVLVDALIGIPVLIIAEMLARKREE